MESEFGLVHLGSVARVRSGYAFRSEDMGNVGRPIIKIKNVVPPTVDLLDCDHVPESVIERIPDIDRYALNWGDILIAMTGATVGKVGRVPRTSERFYLNQRVGKVYLTAPDRADYKYLYYVLSQDRPAQQMLGTAQGSAQPNISGSEIERLEIPLPSLDRQRAIAHVLGTLDDKIELNHCLAQTLESIARALFKSWFIDFDPVHAKAENRSSGLSPALDALFPAGFDDTELGRIPAGWRPGTLGDVTMQRSHRVGNRDAVVLSAVATGQLVRSDEYFTKRVYSAEIDNYLVVEQWDVAYNPSRINIGSVGMLEEAVVGAVSPVYVVFRPEPAYRSLLRFLLQLGSTRRLIKTLASGSVRQSLSYRDLASIPLVIPPPAIARAFAEVWSGFAVAIRAQTDEIASVSAAREELLPRLVSGELAVRAGSSGGLET